MAGRRLARLVLVGVLVLAGAGAARASSAYVNPFPTADYFVGRTDMGVDVCLSPGDPIVAIGNGVVVGTQPDWFAKQPFLYYQLTGGPDAGRYVYVAEQITHLAKVGEQLKAGQTIASYAKKGTCIETGWAAANGATLAQTTSGYHEGQVTPAGISFARFLISLGVQGNFELTAPKAQIARRRRKKVTKPKTTTTTTTTQTTTTTSTTQSATTATHTTTPSSSSTTSKASQRSSTSSSSHSSVSGGGTSAPPPPSGGGTPSSGSTPTDGSSWFGSGGSGGAGWS